MRIRFFLVLCLITTTVLPLAAAEGVIVGDNVALRPHPSLRAGVLRRLRSGAPGTIIDKTPARVKLYGEKYGYHWYLIRHAGKNGWVYGRHFWPLTERAFLARGAGRQLVRQPLSLDGSRLFHLRLAEEPSVPSFDGKGLTGSQTRGLPCFTGSTAGSLLPLWAPLPVLRQVIQRGEEKRSGWFLLRSHAGITERITALAVIPWQGRTALALDIEFDTQTGGGAYRLVTVLRNGRFEVVRHTHLRGTRY
jgi:hypothetical protein